MTCDECRAITTPAGGPRTVAEWAAWFAHCRDCGACEAYLAAHPPPLPPVLPGWVEDRVEGLLRRLESDPEARAVAPFKAARQQRRGGGAA